MGRADGCAPARTERTHRPGGECVVQPGRTRIATASDDLTAKVWDARAGEELLELKGHTAKVLGVAFSPDGARIATASEDRTARVWERANREGIASAERSHRQVSSVAFSPTGPDRHRQRGPTARVWDASAGKELLELRGHTSEISSVAFGPDGARIATASGDRTARVWAAEPGRNCLR